MKKEYANYIVNLYVVLFNILIITIINIEYLFENIYSFFGLGYLIIAICLLFLIILAKKDINRSVNLSFKIIVGMLCFLFAEVFFLGSFIVQRFTFLHWVNFIGGGFIITNSISRSIIFI